MKNHGCILSHVENQKIRLLVLDDQQITLEALKLYFSARSNFVVIGMILDRMEAVAKAKKKSPDVVMVNMRMHHVDAATMTQLLLRAMPQTKVIGFSGLEDRVSILSMIRAGARGYLVRGCSSRELFQAVEAVNRGSRFFSRSVSRIIEEDYFHQASAPTLKSGPDLRECERTILTMIADGHSNKEMADCLEMSVRTIEKYRELLMAKLQIRSVALLTKFAIRHGITSLD